MERAAPGLEVPLAERVRVVDLALAAHGDGMAGLAEHVGAGHGRTDQGQQRIVRGQAAQLVLQGVVLGIAHERFAAVIVSMFGLEEVVAQRGEPRVGHDEVPMQWKERTGKRGGDSRPTAPPAIGR